MDRDTGQVASGRGGDDGDRRTDEGEGPLGMGNGLNRDGIEYNDQIKNRLRRIEGQVRGVLGMMDQEKACKDVVNQLSAIRSAVDRAIMYVVGENMERCIREEVTSGQSADRVLAEAIELLMKSR